VDPKQPIIKKHTRAMKPGLWMNSFKGLQQTHARVVT
jgi:hypothetical protein